MSPTAAARTPAGDLAADVPTLHLKLGALDADSTRVLRGVLGRREVPGAHVVVDLRQLDDSHDLTLFALLATKTRAVAESTGVLTVVQPSIRLGHLLRNVGVTVMNELPTLAGLASLEIVTVGLLLDRHP